jgi:2-polyprenyl-3-methyl-5-hydroxy-6-metoxy-1,4-benzoquinol methylase
MKPLDRLLQRWRIKKAIAYIKKGDTVLDIGSSDGVLFEMLGNENIGIGIDPTLEKHYQTDWYQLVPGYFPQDLPDTKQKFDVISLLAVIEHIPELEIPGFVKECVQFLNPGGRIIITVPSKYVDRILEVLMKLRIIDGMSVDEHHEFEPQKVREYFSVNGMSLEKYKRFQLGLNNLFVFRKELKNHTAG